MADLITALIQAIEASRSLFALPEGLQFAVLPALLPFLGKTLVKTAIGVGLRWLGGLGRRDNRTASRSLVRAPVVNARWILGRARVSGLLAYLGTEVDESRGSDAPSIATMAIVLGEGAMDGIEGVWVDGVPLSIQHSRERSDPNNAATEHGLITPAPGHWLAPKTIKGGGRRRPLEIRTYLRADGTEGAELRAQANQYTWGGWLSSFGFDLHYRQPDGTFGPDFNPETDAVQAVDSSGNPVSVAGQTIHPYTDTRPPWTSQHRLEGVSWVYVRMEQPGYTGDQDDEPRYWKNLPKFEFLVRGEKITWPGQPVPTWTRNAAAIRYWWETERRGRPADSVNREAFDAAFALCGQPITAAGLAGLPPEFASLDWVDDIRYPVDGLIESGEDIDGVEGQLDAAWAGEVLETGGELHFRPGAAATPSVDVNDKDILGGLELQPWRPIQERINAVDGRMAASSAHQWEPYQLPVFEDTAAQQRDGTRRVGTPELRFTSNPITAGRIQAIQLKRNRAAQSIRVNLRPRSDYSLLGLRPLDAIHFESAAYEIPKAIYDIEGVAIQPDASVSLQIREQQTDAYDDEVHLPELPPRQTRIPTRADLEALPGGLRGITGLAIAETATESGGGIQLISLVSTWDASGFKRWQFQLRSPSDAADWSDSETLTLAATRHSQIVAANLNDEFHVRVRGIEEGGGFSAWAEQSHTIQSDIAPVTGGDTDSIPCTLLHRISADRSQYPPDHVFRDHNATAAGVFGTWTATPSQGTATPVGTERLVITAPVFYSLDGDIGARRIYELSATGSVPFQWYLGLAGDIAPSVPRHILQNLRVLVRNAFTRQAAVLQFVVPGGSEPEEGDPAPYRFDPTAEEWLSEHVRLGEAVDVALYDAESSNITEDGTCAYVKELGQERGDIPLVGDPRLLDLFRAENATAPGIISQSLGRSVVGRTGGGVRLPLYDPTDESTDYLRTHDLFHAASFNNDSRVSGDARGQVGTRQEAWTPYTLEQDPSIATPGTSTRWMVVLTREGLEGFQGPSLPGSTTQPPEQVWAFPRVTEPPLQLRLAIRKSSTPNDVRIIPITGHAGPAYAASQHLTGTMLTHYTALTIGGVDGDWLASALAPDTEFDCVVFNAAHPNVELPPGENPRLRLAADSIVTEQANLPFADPARAHTRLVPGIHGQDTGQWQLIGSDRRFVFSDDMPFIGFTQKDYDNYSRSPYNAHDLAGMRPLALQIHYNPAHLDSSGRGYIEPSESGTYNIRENFFETAIAPFVTLQYEALNHSREVPSPDLVKALRILVRNNITGDRVVLRMSPKVVRQGDQTPLTPEYQSDWQSGNPGDSWFSNVSFFHRSAPFVMLDWRSALLLAYDERFLVGGENDLEITFFHADDLNCSYSSPNNPFEVPTLRRGWTAPVPRSDLPAHSPLHPANASKKGMVGSTTATSPHDGTGVLRWDWPAAVGAAFTGGSRIQAIHRRTQSTGVSGALDWGLTFSVDALADSGEQDRLRILIRDPSTDAYVLARIDPYIDHASNRRVGGRRFYSLDAISQRLMELYFWGRRTFEADFAGFLNETAGITLAGADGLPRID